MLSPSKKGKLFVKCCEIQESKMKEDKVVVMGGGAGAHAEAFELARKGLRVNMCEAPDLKKSFGATLAGEIKATGIMEGVAKLNLATTDFQEAMRGIKTIFIAVPSFAHRIFASYCAPYLEDGQIIVITPGTCGSLVFAKELRERGIKKDITIAETVTLPYGARIQGPAHVGIFVKTVNNPVGVFPAKRTNEVVHYLRQFYPEFTPLSNVLEAGLNSTNPVVHPPATLLNVGRFEYATEFWLYKEGMGPSSVKLMGTLMNERAKIGKAFGFNLETGDPLMKRGKEALREFFAGVFGDNSFEVGYLMKGPLSLEDRYVTEDVPYGLVLWESLADMVKLKVPTITAVIEIFSAISGVDFRKHGRTAEELGLSRLSLPQITEFLYEGYR